MPWSNSEGWNTGWDRHGVALPSVNVMNVVHGEDDTTQTTYSFTKSIGGVFTGRKTVIPVCARAASSLAAPTSVVIDGVTASLIPGTSLAFTGGGGFSRIAWYEALVPANTTVVIDVTWPISCARCGMAVFSLQNANTLTDVKTSTADPGAVTLTVADRGLAIGYGFNTHNVGAATGAWTGITEDFDTLVEANNQHTAAHGYFATGGAIAMQCDWSSTPASGAGVVFASFAP